jgi:ABC-type transporter Mla maintaining outer membrane lipid asymmetry ATPase subunit MlaF
MVFQSGARFTSLIVGENVGFYLSENTSKSPAEIAAIVARELDPVSTVNIAVEIAKLNKRKQATTVGVSPDRELAFGIGHRIAVLQPGHTIAMAYRQKIKGRSDPRAQTFYQHPRSRVSTISFLRNRHAPTSLPRLPLRPPANQPSGCCPASLCIPISNERDRPFLRATLAAH